MDFISRFSSLLHSSSSLPAGSTSHRHTPMRRRMIAAGCGLVCLAMLASAPQAQASNKDIIELQTQVEQLQSMLLTIQQAEESHMGALTNMVQQTASSVAKISTQLDAMQKAQQGVQDASNGKLDQVSGQMQSLNDAVDELRARLDKLQKTLDTLQQQQQSLQAGQVTQTPTGLSGTMPGPATQDGSAQPPVPQAPPVDQLYQSALGDYNAAKYNLANQEFGDVIKYYPQNDLAGNAQFYQAEIAYREGDYQTAVTAYTAMLTQYPGNNKAPAAMLRKGQSQIELGEKTEGIHELRLLVQRYPQTPEAVQARSKLSAMGASAATKPHAGHAN
jgi:tol-pal system protein YbgF